MLELEIFDTIIFLSDLITSILIIWSMLYLWIGTSKKLKEKREEEEKKYKINNIEWLQPIYINNK